MYTDLRVGWGTFVLLAFGVFPTVCSEDVMLVPALGQLCFDSEGRNMNPCRIFSRPAVSSHFLCRIALYSANHGLGTQCASLCRLSLGFLTSASALAGRYKHINCSI